jgi:hypothetical protein
MGHYVGDNYSILSNMAPAYHIVVVRVILTSWAHVWRLRFCFLGTGYDITTRGYIVLTFAKCTTLMIAEPTVLNGLGSTRD